MKGPKNDTHKTIQTEKSTVKSIKKKRVTENAYEPHQQTTTLLMKIRYHMKWLKSIILFC